MGISVGVDGGLRRGHVGVVGGGGIVVVGRRGEDEVPLGEINVGFAPFAEDFEDVG